MKIKELFLGCSTFKQDLKKNFNLDFPVTSVTSDSQKVIPGSVFIAVRGTSQDGHLFMKEAEQKGALLIVGEKKSPPSLLVPYLRVQNSRLILAQLAANFFENPAQKMQVIGVTGTSGKTTTTYFLESMLKAAGKKVGVIGTINNRFGKKIFESDLTTPGPVELQRLMAKMRTQGCTTIVMEVSSHALKQKRVEAIAFDAIVFTNLSPEHLDYHLNMKDYFASKTLLFTSGVQTSIAAGKRPIAVINEDDPYGKRLVKKLEKLKIHSKKLKNNLSIRTYGLRRSEHVSGKSLKINFKGIHGKVGPLEVKSPFIGSFNASNILGAIEVAKGLKISRQAIQKGIARLKTVPGRLERVPNQRGIHVWVDYAHKPDALEKTLKGLRDLRNTNGCKKIITVFGCGGDRDRIKRPEMGRIACTFSDWVVITSDNPRTEKPKRIIEEILKGTRGFKNFTVETDREQAIQKSIQLAQPGDVILIAGKGHENYQIVADPSSPTRTKKIPFDDRKIARDFLK